MLNILSLATVHQNASGLVPGRGRGVSGDREPARWFLTTMIVPQSSGTQDFNACRS